MTPENLDSAVNRELENLLCRRAFLNKSATGLGGLALSSLFGGKLLAGALPETKHAKRVIMIFLSGGLSQMELFDEKPVLNERRGEDFPDSIRGDQDITNVTQVQGAFPVVGSAFDFQNYGKCGMRMSELLPHLGGVADDLTLIRSLQTDQILHEAALTQLFTGTTLLGRPSWGAWVSYALGTANEDLPEFVVLLSGADRVAPLHPRLWHSGFLPGRHQGVPFRSGEEPVLFVKSPPGVDPEGNKRILDAVNEINQIDAERSGEADILARIQAYEMAGRMQTSVPELSDLSKETPETLEMYGADPKRQSYANNCLLARRLVERGVRFVQICDGGWDHHFNIPRRLPQKCEQVDKPTAALITDLKERGLLDDTIVLFTGEFGRTAYCEGPLSYRTYGRDHNALCASMLVAGGGFKRGFSYGKSDDYAWDVVEDPVHVHDLQATVLHALGLDHEKTTFRAQGRDFRLTDVHGRVVHDLLT